MYSCNCNSQRNSATASYSKSYRITCDSTAAELESTTVDTEVESMQQYSRRALDLICSAHTHVHASVNNMCMARQHAAAHIYI